MPERILVYILGDVHAEFGRLNSFINERIRTHPQVKTLAEDYIKGGDKFHVYLFQCGDLAFYWPGCNHVGRINNKIDFLPDGFVPIYWCGGNHEDWDRLDRLFPAGSAADANNIAQVDDYIYFCRFGATLQLARDITILFAGGAESLDKDYRLNKMRFYGAPKIWWEQEGISEEDMQRLNKVPEANWVISHTAPTAFNLSPFIPSNANAGMNSETGHSRKMLEKVLLKYRPQKWFFGHYHHFMEGMTDGCLWKGLADLASNERSWDCEFICMEDYSA